jgi:lactate dehydrogenase-like 2-hydroxyacid dehydrogenase
VAAHLDGADVICPLGTMIDRSLIEAGTFGLVQQYGVGIERVDVAAATEYGVWVARIAGEPPCWAVNAPPAARSLRACA